VKRCGNVLSETEWRPGDGREFSEFAHLHRWLIDSGLTGETGWFAARYIQLISSRRRWDAANCRCLIHLREWWRRARSLCSTVSPGCC